MMMPCIDALVLAGGENRRFPTQKAFADIGNGRSIDAIIGLLSGVSRKLYLSANSPEQFFPLGIPMIGDLLTVRGPFNGIYSALKATGSPVLLAAACDTPLVSGGLLRLLAQRHRGQDAVVPVFEGRVQPLPGIYSAGLLSRMKTLADSGRCGLRELLDGADVCRISEEEIRGIDPDGRSFMSINTVEDYQRLAGLLAGTRSAGHERPYSLKR
ncbi:MAG: molybdenum cofactor guanylyltransferase [Thermodesulfovibrionales bacterium]